MNPTQPKSRPSYYANQTPEISYPHLTHDLNAASQHILSTTAFSSDHSICPAADMRASNASLNDYIDKSITAGPVPLFNTHAIVIDPLDIDFNRIGIVLESLHGYLTFMQPINTTEANGAKVGWLSKGRVGRYLVAEWDALPKKGIGKMFICAMGEKETETEARELGNKWHVHSKWMAELRTFTADLTAEVGLQLELEVAKTRAMGTKLPDQDKVYMYVTNQIQQGVLGKVKGLLREETEGSAREEEAANGAMEEFLDFGDE